VTCTSWFPRFRPSFDVLPLATGATALAIYLLHGFYGTLNRDLALYSYAGQQVADGTPPYVGLLNRTGPLSQLIPGLGAFAARTVGISDLTGLRLLFLLISVASVVVVYLLAREISCSRLAGATAAAAFLTFAGFLEYASNGPREKTPMVLFLACSLLALARGRWLICGVFLGLSTLTWQLSFVIGAAAVTVAVVLLPTSPSSSTTLPTASSTPTTASTNAESDSGTPTSSLSLVPTWAQRFQRFIKIAVGGAIPLLICGVYFASVDALDNFMDGFLVINVNYPADPAWKPLEAWRDLRDGYSGAVWVLLVGLLASLGLGVVATVRRSIPRDPRSVLTMAMGAASAVGTVVILREFNNWPDAFALLPLAAVGIGGLARAIVDRLSVTAAQRLAVAWVAAAVVFATVYSIGNRSEGLQDQRASVNAVLRQLPPDATFLSVNAPQPLVLGGKTNMIANQVFNGPLKDYFDDTWPGGLTGFGTWISGMEPTVITLGRGGVPPWLTLTLNAKYVRVGRAPGWTWFVSKSVGGDTVDALRADLSRLSRS
jgi:hypothetical protein